MIGRRAFVKGASMAAIVASASGFLPRASYAQQVPFSAGTEPAKLKAPPNACDCHMHIYNARFPTAPNMPPRADATVDDYRLLQKRTGTSRTIIVTPSTYGTDNRVTLEALAQMGASARAIAVLNASVTDAEITRLDDLGVRGIRFNLNSAGATTIDMITPLSARINEFGWHIQISATAKQIIAMEDLLKRVQSQIVFDHMGHPGQPAGINDPVFGTVSRLIERGRTWVKLSGAYMDTKVGPPTYADITPVGQAYVKAAPERMVWGSDWPHPSQGTNYPDDAILFDLLSQWVPDEATRNRILVRNPETLYRFKAA